MPGKAIFAGKVCIVTGAASGIGFALCQSLLDGDAMVVMADRDEERLAQAVQRCEALPGQAQGVAVDVTRQEAVAAMIQATAARHGRLDCLFNNAGIGWSGPTRDASLETWRRLIDTNLWSVIHGIRAALPIMLRQGGGHIVNTASMMGLVPGVHEAIYAMTKHAVVGLSESLHFELHADGIRVSAVCPGAVDTRFFPKGQTPPEAISASEVARAILAGVADGQRLILVPEGLREFWISYVGETGAAESFFRDLARERRGRQELSKRAD